MDVVKQKYGQIIHSYIPLIQNYSMAGYATAAPVLSVAIMNHYEYLGPRIFYVGTCAVASNTNHD